jgi:Arc/MetJ-type ribon-helix-helix transcriptional regulator
MDGFMRRATNLTSMTVSLPASQKAYVKARAAESGCSTPSEYVRRLIHADQRAREEELLERKILEGIDSPSRVMTSEDWEELRSKLKRKVSRRRKAQ